MTDESYTDELFPVPPPRQEKCRQCKYWGVAKNEWGYGYGVCTLRPTRRNQFGYERRSARATACHKFEHEKEYSNEK